MAARRTPPTTTATIEIQRMRSEPTAKAVFRPPSVPTVFPREPNASRKTFWSRKLTANVATSIVAGAALRSGLKMRSCDERERGDDGEAREDGDDRGLAAQIRERVAAGGDQLAVGEVDEPHHAEHEPDPERDDAVDGAERDRVDHRLEEAHDR